eukprot:TRINITY_DN18481_c0_g1_i1.p1 TRINITY_DN18481_c0_g1~~TRINITY_DN18481_c0_g1_i1.p1  ORF type:complete len:206 (-),score=44.51 TRINITY_DN18481_c0_g1_i1:162-779(-)
MGVCQTTDEDVLQIPVSPALVVAMVAPIECAVDAHEADTVEELLESLAVDRFELRKVDARKLTLEFGDEPMERHRTLVQIGMRHQAEFSVRGVADAQQARPGEELAEAKKVDMFEAASKGRVEEVQLVCKILPNQVNIGQDGRTALHLASEAGHVLVVKALLDARANAHVIDRDKETPLSLARFYAPHNEARAIAHLLARAGSRQ